MEMTTTCIEDQDATIIGSLPVSPLCMWRSIMLAWLHPILGKKEIYFRTDYMHSLQNASKAEDPWQQMWIRGVCVPVLGYADAGHGGGFCAKKLCARLCFEVILPVISFGYRIMQLTQ